MRSRLAVLFVVALSLATTVGGAGAASRVLPQTAGAVDLSSQANYWIYGAVAYDAIGATVAGIDDLNGDGLDDIAVSASSASNNGRRSSGSVYVVFGEKAMPVSPTLPSLDLLSFGGRAFRIDGASAGDQIGASGDGAGDVNGDGLPDIVIGAAGASPNQRQAAGAAYVVFGRKSSGDVDLGALGDGGFRIDGGDAYDHLGSDVSRVGDVNGDGLADVAVAAPYADRADRPGGGAVWVIFGKKTSASVDLANLGAAGFRIDGAQSYVGFGNAVGAAGDVNGDGRADLLIGAPYVSRGPDWSVGAAYVVFGKSSASDVDLAALGDGGFRIDGAARFDYAGSAVASTGDVNGDSRADLFVGAPGASNNDRTGSGSAYIVFGKASADAVDLRGLGANGVRIDGANVGDRAGASLARVGDLNGDHRADFLVGAPGASNNARIDSGSAYAVFDVSGRSTIDLRTLAQNGFRIDGPRIRYAAGTSIADAGDINGDGHGDVVVGSPAASLQSRDRNGAAYVVFGYGKAALEYNAIAARVGNRLAPIRPRRIDRTGSPAFEIRPRLPRGLYLNPLTGAISGKPSQRSTRTYTVTMYDLRGATTARVKITVRPRR